MNGKQGRWLLLGLLLAAVPGTARAGPYFGEWDYCWHSAPGCPRGQYCFLHYWTPYLYRAKYHFCPESVDGYPPGLHVPVVSAIYNFPCRTYPPAPSPPYSYPGGYYGRPLVPSPGEKGPSIATQAKEEEKEGKEPVPIKPSDVTGKKDGK